MHLLRETHQIHQPLTWRQLLLAALLLPFPSRHHLFKGNMGCVQGAFDTFSLPYLIWMDHPRTLKQVVRSEHVYLNVVYLWVGRWTSWLFFWDLFCSANSQNLLYLKKSRKHFEEKNTWSKFLLHLVAPTIYKNVRQLLLHGAGIFVVLPQQIHCGSHLVAPLVECQLLTLDLQTENPRKRMEVDRDVNVWVVGTDL